MYFDLRYTFNLKLNDLVSYIASNAPLSLMIYIATNLAQDSSNDKRPTLLCIWLLLLHHWIQAIDIESLFNITAPHVKSDSVNVWMHEMSITGPISLVVSR